MSVFLIYCIPCSLVGIFLGIMVAAGAKTKKGWWASFLLTALIATSVIAGGFTGEYYSDRDDWNGGNCPCGGEWQLVNVQKYKGSTHYFYECGTCSDVIDLTNNPR